MKRKSFIYALLTLLVIAVIIFRVTVINDYEKAMVVQLKEAELIKEVQEFREESAIKSEFNFISELMFNMYRNRESLYITDNPSVENNKQLVEQFVENYETNYLDAHQLVSDFNGVITFVDKLEDVYGPERQATFWYYEKEGNLSAIEALEDDRKYGEFFQRHIFTVTFQYDEVTKEIQRNVGGGSIPRLIFINDMSEINYGTTTKYKYYNELPNKVYSINITSEIAPKFIETSANKGIKLKISSFNRDINIYYR